MTSTSPEFSLKSPSGSTNTVYKTFYKKGHQMIEMHFSHDGGLDNAVTAVKNWCYKRHLKHIHTVPFLTSLNDNGTEGADLEEIDPFGSV